MPKIIPFKDTLIVKRRKIGTTLKDGKTEGGIILPKTVEERDTDLADVLQVAELTFADQHILDNAEEIVKGLTEKATKGDCEAMKSLFDINDFIKRKSVKVGDAIFLARYSGLDFSETGVTETQTVIKMEDIIALVANE